MNYPSNICQDCDCFAEYESVKESLKNISFLIMISINLFCC